MSLKQQSVSGVKWTTISTVFIAVSGVLRISILARFLEKTDFGLMALVVFVMGFMNLFMNMGLPTAILHRQNITDEEYSSVYWLNIGFSAFLYLLLLGLTPIIASIYNQEELNILLPLMGSGILLMALGGLFKTIEQKFLHFKFISLTEITGALISLLFAIFLAVKGYGVYTLVYSALLNYLILNTAFLIKGLRKVKVRFHFSFNETKPFLRIGSFQVGGQIINYFNRDIDILIIGKFFGAEILGGYSLAKQLVFRPAQIINPILTKVAAPVLARFQKDSSRLKENYLKLLNIVSTINIPAYFLIIILAEPIVIILYGKEYENIVTVVRILSVYMIFRAFGNPVGSLITATGKTELSLFWNAVMFVVLPIAVVIGAFFNIETIATLITISMAALFVPFWKYVINKMIEVSLFEYIKSLIPSTKVIKIIRNSKN
jgi:O-antigen/teichoic acid export membrane protein